MERTFAASGACGCAGACRALTRIVSGIWRGRRLIVPRDSRVRPTAERVREAWLSILMPELPGARVLDLYAGSGALGLEAISRGAAHATFVDTSADSLVALHANIATLGAGERSTVLRADALRFVAGLEPLAFDIALADPPFTLDQAEKLVTAWRASPFASLLAVEHPRQRDLGGGKTRHWGDIAVTFYRAE